jgi:hypothetical protein
MENTKSLKKLVMPGAAIVLGAAIMIALISLNASKPHEDPILEAMNNLVAKGYSDIIPLPGREGVCTSDLNLAGRLLASGSLLKFEREEDSYKKNCSFGIKFTATNPRGFTDGGVLWCGPVWTYTAKVRKERNMPEGYLDFFPITENCTVQWRIKQ